MDNTGSRFDFTVAADNKETLAWEFCRGSGEAFDVSDAVFEAIVTDVKGEVRDAAMAVAHGAEPGCVLVSVAPLGAAVYSYEVWAQSAEGERARLLYGCLTAVSSAAAWLMVQEAAQHPCRVLRVQVPDCVGAPLLLSWRGSSVTAALVADAAFYAAKAEAAAKEAEDKVQGAVEEARRVLEEGNREMKETLGKISGEVKALNAVVAVWDGKIQTAIVLNSETGTLWIGGKDTGCKYKGEDGKSPWISANETWVIWDEKLNGWRDTGESVRGDDGFSPYINALGNWVTKNPLTGKPEDSGLQAVGLDGRDGTAVRRIVVETEGDLPTVPELCNGGVYCYVPLRDAPAVAMLTVQEEGRTADDRLVVDGVEVPLPAPDMAPAEAAAAVAEALAAVGFTAEAEGAMVSLVGDCRHAFVFDALNEDGYSVEVHVGMCREHEYSVYAWLEQPDGSAAWAYVGEAHDFATAEVAGIVKLATDVCCAEGGAPVANNKHGQMVVPHADYTVPGAVLPSEPKTMGSGAVVGFDEAGRMLVALAQYGRYGAVKPSLADVLNAGDDPYKCDDMQGCTGLMADGSLGVAWAQLNRGGAVRLGSELKEQNPKPYLVGVGATPDHKLANNLLYGGALQHKKPNDWTKDGLDWLKPGKYWDGDCFYLGLLTSDSFTQSQEKGLELMDAAAHEGLLGGVVVAHTVTGSPAVVPSGKAWVDYVTGYAYSKSHCDTTYETIRHAADTWEERSHAQATYETKTAAATRESRLDGKISLAQAELRGELNRLSSQKVDKTATWHGDVVLTQAEYNALGSIDPYIKYYIVEK